MSYDVGRFRHLFKFFGVHLRALIKKGSSRHAYAEKVTDLSLFY